MVHQSRGFTLIEILITTVIIALFSGLSLAGYHFFKEQRAFDEETKKVVEALELAKKMAVAGQVPLSYNPATKVCGNFNGEYQFSFNIASYQIGGAGANTKTTSSCVYLVNIYNLLSDMSLINGDGSVNGYYGFRAFGNGVTNYGSSLLNSNGGFSLTITNTTTGKSKTINVNRAGTISVQ